MREVGLHHSEEESRLVDRGGAAPSNRRCPSPRDWRWSPEGRSGAAAQGALLDDETHPPEAASRAASLEISTVGDGLGVRPCRRDSPRGARVGGPIVSPTGSGSGIDCRLLPVCSGSARWESPRPCEARPIVRRSWPKGWVMSSGSRGSKRPLPRSSHSLSRSPDFPT